MQVATKPEWLTVIVTAAYTVVALLQWLAIRRQANLLDRQLKEAKDSSDGIARTASNTLAVISRQADQMERQAGIMERQERDTNQSNADTLAAIGRQATLMERQLEMAERPWLTVKIFAKSDITYDEPGINIPVEIEIKNIGKTPASQVDIEALRTALAELVMLEKSGIS